MKEIKIFKFCFNDKQTIFSKKQIIRKKCIQEFLLFGTSLIFVLT